MTIEKLKSGNYRITQMHKGKRYHITLDYKPSKMEAQRLITAEIDKVPSIHPDITFDEAAAAYIQSKNHILSPSTIYGYNAMRRQLAEIISPSFSQMRIRQIDPPAVQNLINQYAANHSTKSVRNLHGFVSAVLKTVTPNMVLRTSLPPRQRKRTYIPEDADVQAIAQALQGSEYEIPVMLAAFGLRRSEICALELSDFDFEKNSVFIHRVKLYDKDKKWIIFDRTKTPSSTRTVFLPPYVCQAVKAKGYIYQGEPSSISHYINVIQKREGMPTFSLHKLRHYYASMAHAQGVPEAFIMQQGGWSSPNVMKDVYRHAQASREQEMMQKAISHMEQIIQINKDETNAK